MRTTVTIRFPRFRYMVLALFFLLFLPVAQPAAVYAQTETGDPARLVQLAAGSSHSAMLLQDGSLWLWGDNRYGQLGFAGEDYIDAPRRLILPEKAAAVSLGSSHTLILTDSGTVYSIGRNTFGQLGDGTTEPADRPVRVEGLPPVRAIAAGSLHSLALARDGSVWGWGDNSHYQLGEPYGEAIKNSEGSTIGYRQKSPVKVVIEKAEVIAAGGRFSLYLRQDGQLFAWGDNSRGQLGDGTVQLRSRPTAVVGLKQVRLIAAGYQHAVAVSSQDGQDTLFAWGDHSSGQLGLAGMPAGDAYQMLPRQVDLSAFTQNQPVQIARVSAGYAHTAAAAAASGEPQQRLLVWGDNTYGQLGLGHTLSQAQPQAVSARYHDLSSDRFLAFDALACGGFHTLVYSSKGLLAASGLGGSGQLGTFSVVDRSRLTAVQIPDKIKPGWLSEAVPAIVRDESGSISVRWPMAQDNIRLAGYTVRLTWSDGTTLTRQPGLAQEVRLEGADLPPGHDQLALEAVIYAFDEASRQASRKTLSSIAAILLPADADGQSDQDYFPAAHAPVPLADSAEHNWRPTTTGLLQPLDVPWDVTEIYGADALPDAPDDRLLKLLAAAAVVCLLVLLLSVRQVRQPRERRSLFQVMVRRVR